MGWRLGLPFAPDAEATVKRFPLAAIMAALAAAVLVGVATGILSDSDDFWMRVVFGLGTGFLLATAGVFFRESRPYDEMAGFLLAWPLPVLGVALCLPEADAWIVPYALPLVAILWLSVSAFTRPGRGHGREEQQDRFWWLNHQAVTTAAVAIIAFLLVALGMVAIERSLSLLFGLETRDFFYDIVLPVVGGFLTPIYWLSTLPRLDAYDEKSLHRPEFLARAIGFLGQFILAPVLLAYALILLAYTIQIALTGSLPQGMLGWMVLGFTVSGAATYLLVHPPFMRQRLMVRFFRQWWFWLTLVPLGLYGLAVWIRLDAYGLTSERVFLIAGGVWAAMLTLAFLLRRGDIRLIPALAGIALLAISVGPWNFENGPRLQQAARLDRLLTAGQISGRDSEAVWTDEEARAAQGAMAYLAHETRDAGTLREILARHGVEYQSGRDNYQALLSGWGVSDEGLLVGDRTYLSVDRLRFGTSVDVGTTPNLYGPLGIGDFDSRLGGLSLRLTGNVLTVNQAYRRREIGLGDWIAVQRDGQAEAPVIDFRLGGTAYRIVVDSAVIELVRTGETTERMLTSLAGTLFADRPADALRPSP